MNHSCPSFLGYFRPYRLMKLNMQLQSRNTPSLRFWVSLLRNALKLSGEIVCKMMCLLEDQYIYKQSQHTNQLSF